MCHTLLQYYIHCGHSNVAFYPCLPYLGGKSPSSSHSPLHPNYIDPKQVASSSAGSSSSSSSSSSRSNASAAAAQGPGGGRVRLGGPPAYTMRTTRGPPTTTTTPAGLESKPNDAADEVLEDPVFLPSEWRDHGKPRGIAHSYQRPCPDCLEARAAGKVGKKVGKVNGSTAAASVSMREGDIQNAVRGWQRVAQSGALAEENDHTDNNNNHNNNNTESRAGGRERGTRRERTDTFIGQHRASQYPYPYPYPPPLARQGAVLGLLGQGNDANTASISAVRGGNSGVDRRHQTNNTATNLNVAADPEEAYRFDSSDTVLASATRSPRRLRARIRGRERGHSGVSLYEASLRRLTEQDQQDQQDQQVLMSQNQLMDVDEDPGTSAAVSGSQGRDTWVWQWRIHNHSGAGLPAGSTDASLSSPSPSPGSLQVPNSGSILPAGGVVHDHNSSSSTPRRASAVPGVVGRMRRQQSSSTVSTPGSRRFRIARSRSTSSGSHRNSNTPSNSTRVIGNAPSAALIRPPVFATINDQNIADTFMWPLLFLQPDLRLNPSHHPVTGEPFQWSNLDDSGSGPTAIDILHQLIFYHTMAGYDFGDATVSVTTDLLPWYGKYTETEEQAATIAFLHMNYISQWGRRHGPPQLLELDERTPGPNATREELADAIVRVMAMTERERLEGTRGDGVAHMSPLPSPSSNLSLSPRESSIFSTSMSSTVQSESASGSEGMPVESDGWRRPPPSDQRMTYHRLYSLGGDDVFENIRASQASAWDSEHAEINRVLFQHFWEYASISQFDQWIKDQVNLEAILRTSDGQAALTQVISAEQEQIGTPGTSAVPVPRLPGHFSLLARLVIIPELGHRQLQIVAPSGRTAALSWEDLNSNIPMPPTTSPGRENITEGILGLLKEELNALRNEVLRQELNQPDRAPLLNDGFDDQSEVRLRKDWRILCNDATHSGLAKHRHSNKDLMKSVQHYRRREWSSSYGKRPYPVENRREHLTDRTSEVLVKFSGCGHYNAIFVEMPELKEPVQRGQQDASSQCGCNKFDSGLMTHRKAQSPQVCLQCQIDELLSAESLDQCQIRELTDWFGRHVRVVRKQRDITLWPLGSRNSDILEWRA